MSLKRYKLLITLVLPLLFLSACADKSVEVANNATAQTASELNEYSKDEYATYKFSKDLSGWEDWFGSPNIDPICIAYINALNEYGATDDFFQAPVQPNSTEFGYPNWEQWDIYEHKDTFLRAKARLGYEEDDDGQIIYIDRYHERKADLEEEYQMEDNRSEKDKEFNKQKWQMYYARFDIDNDGELEDVVRIDSDRYGRWFEVHYFSRMTTFYGEPKKSFKHMKDYPNTNAIFSPFFYKGKTYIKLVEDENILFKLLPLNKISGELISGSLDIYIYIQNSIERTNLCKILYKEFG
jgi:hypothetical protein